ncbi:aminomethyl-transferring glycine dehydrogenase [bacterium]|nr:aminomethyl-transferring glycine dehydrogenase [bacterium]
MKNREGGSSAGPVHYEGFEGRHIGPRREELGTMLQQLGYDSLSSMLSVALPKTIQMDKPFSSEVFPAPLSEEEALRRIQGLAARNTVRKCYLGMGYHDTFTPTVILRNIFENPGWYTQYTPYQPEISQGRLEALLNYQTMIADLTGLPIVNASLLDEATAAAEAMTMSYGIRNKRGAAEVRRFFVADHCHPQVIEVVQTRAEAVGIEVVVGECAQFSPDESFFGALLSYPATDGEVIDPSAFIEAAHQSQLLVTVSADPLALVLLRSPGSLGADIVVGSSQRFGVPLGYGGPHAAFFATKEEYKRVMPGRLVGVSKDREERPALRLALQTREQHIRREKATSNICTAQVLLAVMAGMYGVYHGPKGLRRIALRVHERATAFAKALHGAGKEIVSENFFDTVTVRLSKEEQKNIRSRAIEAGVLLRYAEGGSIGVSFDETSTPEDVLALTGIFLESDLHAVPDASSSLPEAFLRDDEILTHPVFHEHRSESKFLRYVKKLESKDLSLTHSMIPLGSCTMKLNATSEMIPVSYEGFSRLHPFAPLSDAVGYLELFSDIERLLAEVTGFDAVSLQPNAGSQGEYAGLLAIRRYHHANGDANRDVCLIPVSAHGTNPASAVMAGMKVVIVQCDDNGNIDVEDLRSKAEEHASSLSCLMITYPSTHGVFEGEIQEICEIIHANGGQVYLDGANLNALVGLSQPASFGADVCHFNLHKTFCIPHGGGGPGMGPIGVRKHLEPHLPGHLNTASLLLAEEKDKKVADTIGNITKSAGAVSAAPWGSASILPISWMYMAMMGAGGLQRASEIAILNANYIAHRLQDHYPVLYRGNAGLVAHECILDVRAFKQSAGVEAADIAKRLMDYGFHAPTMSWPVAGTLMVEPTESESKVELDRFCDAMIAIRGEITAIEEGRSPQDDNPLRNAPHTAAAVTATTWERSYTREEAAYPAPWTKDSKFWPSVARIEESYGDRNLVCTCPPLEEYASS